MAEKPQRIQPRILSGFRDYLPSVMIPREQLMETARRVYRTYGFFPIDTPSLEYYEILSGKGGEESDKQMYQFRDHGDRHVGMRFDLTVPPREIRRATRRRAGRSPQTLSHCHGLARRAQTARTLPRIHGNATSTPSAPNRSPPTSKRPSSSTTFLKRSVLTDCTICVNNRKVLGGLLEKLGLAEQSTSILRALDKLAKIGPAKVADEMKQTAGVSSTQAEQVLRLANTSGTNEARSA